MSLRDNHKQDRRYRRKANKLAKQLRHTKAQRDILMRYCALMAMRGAEQENV